VSEKVWNRQKDVIGKSEFMGKRNVKKNGKQREKLEKNKENKKKRAIWIWWYLGYGKCIDGTQLWKMEKQRE